MPSRRRMRRRGSRRNTSKLQTLVKWLTPENVLAVIVILVLIVGAFTIAPDASHWVTNMFKKGKLVRADNNCIESEEHRAPRRTAILVDATDAIPAEAVAPLMTRISVFMTAGLAEERFSFYAVDDQDYELALENASACRPKAATKWEDLETFFISETKDIERRWQNFVSGIEEYVRELAQQPQSSFSPILEMIAGVAERSDRIVIISDMLQHMPKANFTHYTDNLPAISESDAYLKQLGAGLRDKEIYVCYLHRYAPREKKRQTREHWEWWNHFFKDIGGVQRHRMGRVHKNKSGEWQADECLKQGQL